MNAIKVENNIFYLENSEIKNIVNVFQKLSKSSWACSFEKGTGIVVKNAGDYIIAGGVINFYHKLGNTSLNKNKIIYGVTQWLNENKQSVEKYLSGDVLKLSHNESICDILIQYALFGDIIYRR